MKKTKETVEEAAAQFAKNHSIYPTAQDDTKYGFINGAKWQAKRMYSEEDLREAFENGVGSGKYQAKYGDNAKGSMNFEYFIKHFKKH